MRLYVIFVWAIAICTLCSCSQMDKSFSDNAILIREANILDLTEGKIIENQYLVIDSGKIVQISNNELSGNNFAQVIEGTGKYLMPGLAEMHAHIPPPTTEMERIEETLFLYLSNGITIIRGMLGDSLHLSLREKAANGELLSPRIFTSSPSLNGNTVTTMEEADRKVRKYHLEGYDFLKIHPGIQRPVFDQLVATANEVGIPFAGHVPVDVGIRHALESKYASIDHVDGFLEGLVPDAIGVDPTSNGFFGYNFVPFADTTLADELVSLARENRVWIVPTQSLFERWFAPVPAKTLAEQPEMQYMPGSTQRSWLRAKNQYMESETFFEEQWRQFDEIRRMLISKLQADGHGILMGSDAPQIYNVPGFSIHHEIDGMQRAGLTNLEILRSGTINPAIFFGKENTFGAIREGLDADLIILNQNPLEDLDALKDLYGVMRLGRWIPKEEIDKKLAQIASNASNN